MLRPPPRSTLFPYPTLFRSVTRAESPAVRAAIVASNGEGGRLAARLDSQQQADRKSTRLNSSHRCISYAVFCLKKKKTYIPRTPEQTDPYHENRQATHGVSN